MTVLAASCWRWVSNVVAAVPRWCLRFVVAVPVFSGTTCVME